jgi:hypothetical protein
LSQKMYVFATKSYSSKTAFFGLIFGQKVTLVAITHEHDTIVKV